MSKKVVMITGCAGFIGSHTVDKFLDEDYRVVGVDNFSYSANILNLESRLKNKKKFILLENDIADYDEILKICKETKVEEIINFAAQTHVDNSIKSAKLFIHSNIVGVESLLRVCRDLGIRLFHISTDEVVGPRTIDRPAIEHATFDPKNPYSASKTSSELFINSYNNTFGNRFIIVRPSNNFGPRQHVEKFLPKMISNILQNKKIPVYGDGLEIRDWLFVKDTAKIIYEIFLKSSDNQVYNVTKINHRKNIDMVKIICDTMKVDYEKYIEYVPQRLGHDFCYSITNDKIKNLSIDVSYSVQQFLKDLEETIQYYKNEII